MRRLDVDFAPRRRPVLAIGIWCAACSIAAVVAGVALWQGVERREAAMSRLASAEAESSRLQSAIRARSAQASTQTPPRYARDAVALMRTAGFPMQSVLRSIETVNVEGVRVMGLDAGAARGTAELTLEFDDDRLLMQYLEALNAGEGIETWSLVRADLTGAKKTAVLRMAAPRQALAP